MPPPPSARDDERLQRGGARGGARAVAEERGRERVADLDQLAAQAEAGVDDDAGEEQAPDQVLERVAGSACVSWLIASPAPTSRKRTSSASAAIRLICHKPATCALLASCGRGEHGLADQLEHRVERVEDEPLEPVVDRLLDPAGQIPEVRDGSPGRRRRSAVWASASSSRWRRADLDAGHRLWSGLDGGRAAGGRHWSSGRGRRGRRQRRQRRTTVSRRSEQQPCEAAAHPPTIFWMIVTITGANSAKA